MKSQNMIIGPVARLKKVRLYLGMTRQQFGDALAISQYTIRSWENGAKTFTADGVQRVVSALKGKINFSCSFDWLMHGIGSSPISLCEENKIQDDFFVSIESSNEKILNEIVSFKQNNKSANVIFVSDNTFNPIADIGDYVGLAPVGAANIEKYLEKLVLVTLENDLTKFGILKRARHYFNVVSLLDGSNIKLSANDINKMSQFVWLRKIY